MKGKNLKKALALTLTICMSAGLMAGCGKAGSGESTGDTAQGKQESQSAAETGAGRKKDTITILMESVPDTEAVREVAKKFTENTGVTVNIEAVNYTVMHEKLVTQLVNSTSSYDVLIADNLWIGEFAEAGWVEPLDPYIERDGFDMSVYLDSMLEMMTANTAKEVTYFIPFCSYTYSLLYRKDIFEDPAYQAAYQEKTGKELKVPDNMEDYVEISKFITEYSKGEIYGTAMQGQRSDPITMEWSNYLFGCGGDYYNENNEPTINSPEAVKALNYYIDNITHAAPTGSAGFGFDEALNVFSQGKAAMYIGNYWMVPVLNDDTASVVSGKVDITSAPGGHSNNGGWGWALPANGEDKETAWEFISFIESFESAKARAMLGGSPTRSDVFQDQEVLAAFPYYEKVLDIIANAKQLPRISALPQVLEILGRELSEAVAGNKEPQAALDVVYEEMLKLK